MTEAFDWRVTNRWQRECAGRNASERRASLENRRSREGAGDEQNNGTIRCSFNLDISAFDNPVGRSLDMSACCSREKQGGGACRLDFQSCWRTRSAAPVARDDTPLPVRLPRNLQHGSDRQSATQDANLHLVRRERAAGLHIPQQAKE
jgi:hypothetical protein